MFDERDCLDVPYALGAWEDLQAEIADGAIPNYSWEQFMNDLGLNSLGQEEYEKFGKTYNRSILTDINRMINRVAALTDRRQDLIFDLLRERIDGRIEKAIADGTFNAGPETRSEEHTSGLQSLMRISYAVFCLKKKKQTKNITT